MKRQAESDLKVWFQKKDRTPLIIRGARQVGKTTLVRQFCKNESLDLLEINLEYSPLKSELKMEAILDEIELLTKKKIGERSILFLDEIQESPSLIKFLRYFYELRPDIAVIAAGSLLEIVINEGEYSFPVGRVSFYYLGPMTFIEFLLAVKEEQLAEKLMNGDPPSEAVHQLCLGYLKKFFYLGGMPKVIATYLAQGSMEPVREVQEQIIQTYMADFPKYKKRVDVRRMGRIFNSAALSIGKKINYQALDRESSSRDIKRIFELFIDARIVLAAIHTEASGTPLLATQDDSIFKYFFLDIGLLNCIHRLDYNNLQDEFKNNFVTKGFLAEQFVAQHLLFFDGHTFTPKLNYWLRDKGTQKGEIDFVLEHKSTIWPIEVKAESGGKLKSLFYFSAEKKIPHGIKFSLAPWAQKKITHKIYGVQVEVALLELPLYLVEVLRKYLP
ncbi:MAG: ATP-binding protein [Oligoflexia bacterium]|nr:ATP-binding protein [Oligoflexia bacterium]MBF0364620.1 ATP-binding protein [Oligoflexia bacterium]